MPATRKRVYLGTMPKGVSSPWARDQDLLSEVAPRRSACLAEQNRRHGGAALRATLEGRGSIGGRTGHGCPPGRRRSRGGGSNLPGGRVERACRANLDGVQQVADFSFIGRDDALQHRAPGARAARDAAAAHRRRRGRDHVRLAGEARHES